MELSVMVWGELGGTFRYIITLRTYNNESGYTVVNEGSGFATFKEAQDAGDTAKVNAVGALFQQVTAKAIAAPAAATE